jgi:hypothetical protein
LSPRIPLPWGLPPDFGDRLPAHHLPGAQAPHRGRVGILRRGRGTLCLSKDSECCTDNWLLGYSQLTSAENYLYVSTPGDKGVERITKA